MISLLYLFKIYTQKKCFSFKQSFFKFRLNQEIFYFAKENFVNSTLFLSLKLYMVYFTAIIIYYFIFKSHHFNRYISKYFLMKRKLFQKYFSLRAAYLWRLSARADDHDTVNISANSFRRALSLLQQCGASIISLLLTRNLNNAKQSICT